MREFRVWSDNTYNAYLGDVDHFEDFSLQEGIEPTLGNISLHHVNRWINWSNEEKVAFKTTQRRKASLASLFKFYQAMGTIISNPFQATVIPEAVGYHSEQWS
ncbi:site-specific integrase [Bacillus sp. DJP31]|uniref:site-specific integrase n=1 Tax=Bacillus sp. DJP31 TaxID=3409789 RepID=UPI003BB6D542